MSVDRVLAIRRRRSSLPGSHYDNDEESVRLSASGTWLTVVGFCLYATVVSIILTASRSSSNHISLICAVYVQDRSETLRGIPVS